MTFPPTSEAASDDRSAAGGIVTVELSIDGMHCASCVAITEEALADCAGVRRAAVDLESALAQVTFDPAAVTVDQLCAAVIGQGYMAVQRSDPHPQC